MNKISRKGFLKIAAAAAMSGVTAGALSACNSSSSSVAASGASVYTAGTYTATAKGMNDITVTMTFSDTAITEVKVDTANETLDLAVNSAADFQTMLMEAQSAEIDGVSGATVTSNAVKEAAADCIQQAMGLTGGAEDESTSYGDDPRGAARAAAKADGRVFGYSGPGDWLGEAPAFSSVDSEVDCDVCVVGLGHAGVAAVLGAAEKGAKVVGIESQTEDNFAWYGEDIGAWNSKFAQDAGIPAWDLGQICDEFVTRSGGRADPGIVSLYVQHSGETLDHMLDVCKEMGVDERVYTYDNSEDGWTIIHLNADYDKIAAGKNIYDCLDMTNYPRKPGTRTWPATIQFMGPYSAEPVDGVAANSVLKYVQQAQLDNATRAKEMDFLSFEIGEIEEAALQKGEDEALEDDYKRLANGKEILESVLEAHQLCASDGASEAIGRALRSLASVSEYDSDLKALYNQLMDVDSLLNDFNREISGYADELDVDEETLKKTEERLDLINHLKTKYGDTIEKIQAYCEEKKQRFAVLENYEGYLAERKSRFAACKKQLQKEAENLTVIRKEAAQRFTEQVKQALMDLNFLDVQFELDFRLLEDYMVSGQDEVCFMISTNPGQPLRPVQDTASGGELSRIMLAVKSVMADQEKVETLIFDEIDSGISGRTAQMVSEKLALIAGNHQVICITHLAQIAAMADVHFMIEKKVIENETQTSIRQLDEKESIDELARILGGAKITQMVLDSAKEMRQLAKNARGHGFQNEPE